MTAQDKLATGMSLFALIFVIAFLLIPPSAFRDYFAALNRRKRGRIIKALLAGVFALSLPYFYDQLIDLDSKDLSTILQMAMGACAYGLLLDIVWFIYKSFGPPSRRRRAIRK